MGHNNPNFHCLDPNRRQEEYEIDTRSGEKIVVYLVSNPDGTNTLNVRIDGAITALTISGKDMEVLDWWGWGRG